MFSVSAKADYALALLLYLGENLETYKSVSEISKDQELPSPYLAQIIAPLKEQGWIRSKEGKGGGHCLNRPLKEISVLEVLEAVEGPITMVRCLDKGLQLRKLSCQKKCPSMDFWRQAVQDFRKYLGDVSLKSLLKK